MNTSYGLYPIGEPYLYDVLERKLEKRSEKGWMADYVGVFFIKYKKCEPKHRKVQIVYDPDNVEYQTEKSEYSEGLEYYIEDAGWVKACDYFKQKIYYNDDPDAVPVYTDDREKLESIKESMVGLGLITYWTLGFMFLFGLMFGGGLIRAIDHITLSGVVFAAAILCWPLYLLVSYIMYSLWEDKSVKNLELGLGLASTEPSHIASIVMVVLASVTMVLMIVSNLSSDSSVSLLKQLLSFISLFLIMSVGRRVGVALKDRKAVTIATYIIMVAVFFVLKAFIDMCIAAL